ncbi:MAG: hypothetical protein U0T75_13635 [Chitinophagales bacterium]
MMLLYETLIGMEDEIEKAPEANNQGNLTSSFNDATGNSVSKNFAFHHMWQKVFNKLSVFSDNEYLNNNKTNRFLKNEIKINPNWPLRDGDL